MERSQPAETSAEECLEQFAYLSTTEQRMERTGSVSTPEKRINSLSFSSKPAHLPGYRTLNLSDEDTPTDEISRIEAQLEELADVSARCRKIMLGSKAAIIGGASLLLLMMLGLFGSNPVAALGSIAVVLGGIVSLGANASTLEQTIAAMNAAETLRSALISKIDPRLVGERKL